MDIDSCKEDRALGCLPSRYEPEPREFDLVRRLYKEAILFRDIPLAILCGVGALHVLPAQSHFRLLKVFASGLVGLNAMSFEIDSNRIVRELPDSSLAAIFRERKTANREELFIRNRESLFSQKNGLTYEKLRQYNRLNYRFDSAKRSNSLEISVQNSKLSAFNKYGDEIFY